MITTQRILSLIQPYVLGWIQKVVYHSGATGDRPSAPVTGQLFFDTTLGIPIWWDGSNWIDAAGTTV